VISTAAAAISADDCEQLQLEIELEVMPRDRAPYRARTRLFVSAEQRAELRHGASVAVRFDPVEPTSVVLEPLVRRVVPRASA
jgi:hypothetical protein